MASYEEPVQKEGYLVKAPDAIKHLHNFRKWQRKYFRLDARGDLYYYDNEKSSRPAGMISIPQCVRLFNAKGKFADQLSYCIGLELIDTAYYIKAESARIYNEWIEPLKRFARNCELSLLPDSSPANARRPTFTGDTFDGATLRTESITSRHFSINTRVKFLSKEGWLAKTGGNNKGWKDRYFVLSNGKMTYYKNEKINKDNSQGSIDLFECVGVDKTGGRKGFGFDIKMPGRVFNISVDSEANQNEWMFAINHSLGLIKDIKNSTSGITRSDSNSSEHSRELALLESLAPPPEDVQPVRKEEREVSASESSSSFPLSLPPTKKEDKKDSDVVQLLEVEVDALRHKVASLETDLNSSTTANTQLQHQLSEVKSSQASSTRQLTEERNNLQLQMEQLQKSKSELETVNDSLSAQLDEHILRLQEMEEEQIGLRQDLDEAQAANTAAEEELVETQQKLREIEEVARGLEDALKKRGESEPQTPLTSSVRALGQVYQEKLDSPTTASLPEQLNSDSENKMESLLVEKLKVELKQIELEKSQLEEKLKAIEDANSNTEEEEDMSSSLSEERLRWQMEKENLRKELMAKMDSEREPILKEKEALENKLRLIEEAGPTLTREQVTALEQNLTQSQTRVQQLESEVATQAEKISQLLVEKEKAVADLIAIRKINRTIEKKISETEVSSSPVPMTPTDSPVPGSVQDADKVIEDLKNTLKEVENERDELKAQLEQRQSVRVDLANTSPFRFRSKTMATVATNNQESSVADVNTNGNPLPNQVTDNPPPKPKRPPKEIISRYSNSMDRHQQQQQNSKTVNILQSLFARR